MSAAFLLTSLVVIVTPGTGVLLTIGAGLRGGRRHGAVTAFGCTLGIVPHLVAAGTGAAALLRAGGLAFELLKVVGVGYLLYMAWSTWRVTGVLDVAPAQPRRPLRTVVEAVLANLLNPKLTIFFVAFLPQFVSPRAAHPVLDLIRLSTVFMLLTFVVFVLYGVFAAAAGSWLKDRPRVVRRLYRAFSVAFVGLAGRLAVENG